MSAECPSSIHRVPVPATVPGTYGPGKIRVSYCDLCAMAGAAYGLFTPDNPPTTPPRHPLPPRQLKPTDETQAAPHWGGFPIPNDEPICECEYLDVLEFGPPMVERRPDCPVHGDFKEEADK